MTSQLNKVALRYKAIYLDIEEIPAEITPTAPVMAFVARLRERGYAVSEELLRALYSVPATTLSDITKDIDKALGVNLNWAPLVKGWDVPTGETFEDHLVTWFVNLIGADVPGTQLPCGHFIPDGTFPLERYNGCPYCGRPFVTANYVHKGQGTKLKELRLMRRADMEHLLETLLQSPTPLDATQLDSVKLLIRSFGASQASQVPGAQFLIRNYLSSIKMKETRMVVIEELVKQGRGDEAQPLFDTPTDVLRFLWYEKTRQLLLLEPRTLVAHAGKLNSHLWALSDRSAEARAQMREILKLKYDRRMCRTVARWLNGLPMTAQSAAEAMNPKRGMWVRMIRALRLGEYGRKEGYEQLHEMLDIFYHHRYTTWEGCLDEAYRKNIGQSVVAILVQRPSLFSRRLFAAMLHFGCEAVLPAFRQVVDKVPSRLLFSLENAAQVYFDPEGTGAERLVRPITGEQKVVPANKLLALYSLDERQKMADSIGEIFIESMERRYSLTPAPSQGGGEGIGRKTPSPGEGAVGRLYVEPRLYDIPLAVGDRTTTIQDTSCALQGTRFRVEGDQVRLFLQWGVGLPAQHLDMDLSARIVMEDGQVVECAYFNLAPTIPVSQGDPVLVGAKHSGDIREIPDKVGTAEYIELDLPMLGQAGARYVAFTCNAYSHGALSPNLMVGWMSASQPMTISEKDGVAYDPSTVQHIVRVSESNLQKGLVFGVLKVREREIVWLELPFTAQNVAQLDGRSVEALLHRMERKVSIGQLLELKARAEKKSLVSRPEDADERYTYEWALNSAEVATVLLP